jgi:hypothetical protein
MKAPDSPRIASIAWGAMNVEGIAPGRDFKLWPGGGRAWDWNETGTRHAPGIQPSDVEELIAKGSTIVVLSQGMHRRLETSPETIEFLRERGIEYRIAETGAAVDLYNRLASEGEAVGGLFHTTC